MSDGLWYVGSVNILCHDPIVNPERVCLLHVTVCHHASPHRAVSLNSFTHKCGDTALVLFVGATAMNLPPRLAGPGGESRLPRESASLRVHPIPVIAGNLLMGSPLDVRVAVWRSCNV